MARLVALILFILLMFVLYSGLAHAHGDADWINRMQLGCCGPTDCQRVPDGTWEREGRGYRSTVTGEFVLDAAAKASVDGGFWECRDRDGTELLGEEPRGRLRNVLAQEGGVCLFVPSIGF